MKGGEQVMLEQRKVFRHIPAQQLTTCLSQILARDLVSSFLRWLAGPGLEGALGRSSRTLPCCVPPLERARGVDTHGIEAAGAYGRMIKFPKDREPHTCYLSSPPYGVVEPGKLWVEPPPPGLPSGRDS